MKRTLSDAAINWAMAAALLAGSAGAAAAQVGDPLVKAKTLYAEAAYEEALKVLTAGEGPEAHQYRALCFIALGRGADAERAIESLVRSTPMYKVSDAELPPRLVSLITQTRQRVMPDVVRELFTQGRNDFQAKELQRARTKFEQVLTLLKDPAMTGAPDTKDLELLTTGYLDIVKNTPPPAPVPVRSPVTSVAAAPAPVAPAPVAPRLAVVRPAVTIEQTIPPLALASNSTQTSESGTARSGAVRVVIGTDGRVKSAVIERPIEPRYDSRLLQAARSWRYRPATRDGKPVESEKLVEIQIDTR